MLTHGCASRNRMEILEWQAPRVNKLLGRNSPARANIKASRLAVQIAFLCVENLRAVVLAMSFHVISRSCMRYALAFTLVLVCSSFATAQTEEFGNSGGDPIKLFDRGQDAHAKGDYKLALEFYEEAIKLRPEFPEAELQRGQALVSLNRREDAELAFRRAIELRPTWVLPYAKLGFLLARIMSRPGEAEPVLRKALELEPKNFEALFELANFRGGA